MPSQITAVQTTSPEEPAAAGLLVDVIVMSAESSLFDSIRHSVGERNPVWRARSAEEAVDMLLLGRCGVLIVDMASVPIHSAPLIERIHAQFPDVVVVVAGSRDDEAALTGLVSDGLIYRYMHKPLSAKRAGMFLNAAIQQYVERRSRRDFAPLLPLMGRLPERVHTRYWVISAAVIIAVVLGVVLLPHDESAAPSLLTPPVAAHPDAVAATPRADPVLSRARAALAAGRYEAPAGRNALDLYRAVLLAKPEHTEARAGLERTLEAIVADAQQHWDHADRAEAERLLHRVLEAEPAQPAARTLLASMQPAIVEDAPAIDEAVATAPADATGSTPVAAPAPDPTPTDPKPQALQQTSVPVAVATTPATPSTIPGAAAKVASSASTAAPLEDRQIPIVVQPASRRVVHSAKTHVAPAAMPHVAAPAMPQDARPVTPKVAAATAAKGAAIPAPTAVQAPHHPVVPVPDPLQPKLAMASTNRTTQRGRVFGAPISSGHPTAGIDTRPYVPPTIATAAVNVDEAAARTRVPLPVAAAPRPQPAFLDSRELEQVSTVEPTYPAAAMRTGQQGWVTLEFTVTEAGAVIDPWVTDAEPADVFDAAAIAAVRQWRFKPRVANGRAVAVRSSVTLRFEVER